MSKLIKVVGSLSYFHVEAHVAQRRFPVIAIAELSVGYKCLTHVLEVKMILRLDNPIYIDSEIMAC